MNERALPVKNAEEILAVSEYLSGEKPPQFEWISNEADHPYVTIDSQQRLYISKPARILLGLPDKQGFRLMTGYDYANHRIVLAKPETVRLTNNVPYKFDKRSYSKVKRFVERANLERDLPIRFVYVGREFSWLPAGSFAFTRTDRESEDV